MNDDYLSGADRIARERMRQQVEEGRHVIADVAYAPGTLAMASLCYTLIAASSPEMRRQLRPAIPFSGHWPWPEDAWKPSMTDSHLDRVRELEKAGALIAAQIDAFLFIHRMQEQNANRDVRP